MNLNEELELAYETFEGDIRKLDELISQLELWSDECTINHKKEEIRLTQYMELHLNLEELKGQLEEQISTLSQEKVLKEAIEKAKIHIAERLQAYKCTEEVIHHWIREIQNIYVLVSRSRALEENKDYIESILKEKK